MKLIQSDLPDVVVVEPSVFSDDRGWFTESFNEKRFQQGLEDLGLAVPKPFIQDNHSCSRKGVLRGLHYQADPHAQGKLVRVVKGAVLDVTVDLRETAPTFGNWIAVELSEKNQRQLWIPEGFAHGFLTLEDDTHFLYKTTNYYCKEAERSLAWNDPTLAIHWPRVRQLLISEKDKGAESFLTCRKFN